MSCSEPHILVTGDAWQYVPFGRSRLKALCATGLSYASQTFTMPDGATIKVRIAGTQSFISASGGGELYMESGQLAWGYPAPESPSRGDPATWYFMDIPTTDKYLGRISSDGTQGNTPVLAEAQDSLAIGYPKAKSGTDAEKVAADAKTKEDYIGATVMKKMVAAVFPASLFSGKMRLFMQAQYGAKEAVKSRLQIELVGTSPILTYNIGEQKIQFGFWVHATPGIFTAPDGTYWLLNITQNATAFVVTSYPISTGGSSIHAKLNSTASPLSPDDRAKAEAYLFANSTIAIGKAVIVGTHPLAAGWPMAYGWKFSMKGDKASIVLNQTINSGLTRRYFSRTVNLSFDLVDGAVTMSGATTDNGEWIDGWGTYNIFAPDTETVIAPLSLYSQAVGSPKATSFNFSNIVIYGYYVDDLWTPIKLSNDDSMATGTHVYKRENVYIAPSTGGEFILCGSSWKKYWIDVASGGTSTISIGGFTYVGSSRSGTIYEQETTTVDAPTHGPSSAVTANFWYWPAVGTNGVHYSEVGLPSPPGTDTLNGVDPATGPWPAYAAFIERTFLAQTRVTTSGLGAYANAWALVIPGGDCEAAYLAQSEYSTFTGSPSITTQVGTDAGPDATWGWISSPLEAFVAFGYFYADLGIMASITSTTTVSGTGGHQTYDVKCFNTALAGSTGTPGGSYYTLFNVAYTYPFYDRGMYAYTSNGKRYVMSEGLKSPASAYYDRRFVGWA